jgi:hypothetical protein
MDRFRTGWNGKRDDLTIRHEDKIFVIVAIAFINVVVVQHADDLVFGHVNENTCRWLDFKFLAKFAFDDLGELFPASYVP